MTLLVFVVMTKAAALSAQSSYPGEAALDRAIREAVAQDQIPGAVVQIGKPGQVQFRQAWGSRALEPSAEPMTLDTIFDAASLTKVVATTSSIMALFEQGRLRLNDAVTVYLPEFQGGKSEITVRHLLTHFSGLRPDVDLEPAWSGYETGVKLALVDKPVASPGARFLYSDINFVLLGEIVRRLSGKPLSEFAREGLFEPLGMRDTMFQPPRALRARIAPTEKESGMAEPLRGVVHDPTARFMGGVAGHAGLFTTAADLGRFAAMILEGGRLGSNRLFQAATVRKFTEPNSPAFQPMLRGLGWDIDTRFSANRGELFPLGSFGHTGFTGTSLWIDPSSHSYVVLLANSVHPRRRPAISSLRSRVATIAAAHAGITLPGAVLTSYNETLAGAAPAVHRNGEVLTGLDVLEQERFARLMGKRVGLITNHTGINRAGRRGADVMKEAGVNLAALFAPEHGISGAEDHENVADSRDAATGVPVYSLYQGDNRTPSREMLANVDVLVFDIQDIGARFYTYMCTLLNVLEAAAPLGLPVMVLDRPNPITGARVEGPMLDDGYRSFVGCYGLPLRHGMTLGEIARMANQVKGLGAKLEVVAMKGWRRRDWFDSTGLPWVNPSPAMRSLPAATLYPGIALLEYSKDYSVGRGTETPFEVVGAPWIQSRQLAAYLNRRFIPGIRVYPVKFQADLGKRKAQNLEGVRFLITDREAVSTTLLGLEVAAALAKLYPGRIDPEVNRRLIGNRAVIEGLRAGTDPRVLVEAEPKRLAEFLRVRTAHLLYQ